MVPSSQGQTGMITSSSGFHFDLQWGQTRQKIGKKKGWKNNNPKSSLRNGVSPKPKNQTSWTWKIELIRTEVLSYVQSKKHSIHLSDYILYPVLFLFISKFSHRNWSFLFVNGHFKQKYMVFVNWKYDKKFLKFMNNHECIIWKISLGRMS